MCPSCGSDAQEVMNVEQPQLDGSYGYEYALNVCLDCGHMEPVDEA